MSASLRLRNMEREMQKVLMCDSGEIVPSVIAKNPQKKQKKVTKISGQYFGSFPFVPPSILVGV